MSISGDLLSRADANLLQSVALGSLAVLQNGKSEPLIPIPHLCTFSDKMANITSIDRECCPECSRDPSTDLEWKKLTTVSVCDNMAFAINQPAARHLGCGARASPLPPPSLRLPR